MRILYRSLNGILYLYKNNRIVKKQKGGNTYRMKKQQKWLFIWEKTEFSGVQKIAEKVKKDIFLVTGEMPENCDAVAEACDVLVVYGTVGKSRILEEFNKKGLVELEKIRGKREVYSFSVLENPAAGVQKMIVIAGSEKRGTIYGLFHLSELMGVSPLVDWNHVRPVPHSVNITKSDSMVSKEPSVRYRGFFINDEWPAFGNWAMEHFGGLNAQCYEKIFELLLRLKGNYLWPAMWNSNFNLDGPGLKSAELADEYGIVMSTSHHEPCMRAGEEYNFYKGDDSPYGNAWDFRKNREGITNFWRDGLLRNKDFENVITMGMRGERDSAILGKNATIEDNVRLIKDVLKTQNRLIRECVNEDLSKVPRQIVLFSEVEEFFYGNNGTSGLLDEPELDGVTLMLSDNNHGCTRTLPTEKMKKHPGGFGMYYHMDMHGGAHSYKWIGSTYLPRVCEQMTQAYEYGVREIWITNVGDVGTQEYGLSYFLDMAYDMEKWGGSDCGITEVYTHQWTETQFAAFSPEDRQRIEKLMWGYTSLLAKRKHEIMNADTYHPAHYNEAAQILAKAEFLLAEAEELKERCPKEHLSSFISLLYYPVCGTANLMKLWILAGRNKLFAEQNRVEANLITPELDACMKRDQELIEEYEQIDNGYYKGFGDSLHIGFTNWNEEDCKAPVKYTVYPAKTPRMLMTRPDDTVYSTGLEWNDHKQIWDDFLRPDRSEIRFSLANGSDKPYFYELLPESDCISLSAVQGKVSVREDILVTLDREKVSEEKTVYFRANAYLDPERTKQFAATRVGLRVAPETDLPFADGTFVEYGNEISIPAVAFTEEHRTAQGEFRKLEPYGKTGSAVKAFPVTTDFNELKKYEERPYVEYCFAAQRTGEYHLRFYLAPATPVVFEPKQYLAYSVNGGEPVRVNTVENEKIPFFSSPQWEREAKDCIKLVEQTAVCQKGENRLRVYAMSPGIVLEKIVLWPTDTPLKESYLGPTFSYRVSKEKEVSGNYE